MKKSLTLKPLLLSMAVTGATTLSMFPAATQAGVSANVGFVSNYIFRGVQQTTDASPQLSGGLDYAHDSGLYAGLWASTLYEDDLGQDNGGLEYDLYFGWSGSFEGFGVGLGYTNYSYTGDVSDGKEGIKEKGGDSFGTFEEINLSAGYGPVSAGYDIGTDNATSTEADYDHYYIAFDADQFVPGVSLTYGAFGGEYDGDYFDLGYSTSMAGVDLGGNVIFSDEDASGVAGGETYYVVSVSKSFDLM